MSKEWKTLSKEIVDKLIDKHLDKDKPADECLMPNCHNKRRWLAKGGFSKFCSEQCSYNFRGFVKKLKCEYVRIKDYNIAIQNIPKCANPECNNNVKYFDNRGFSECCSKSCSVKVRYIKMHEQEYKAMLVKRTQPDYNPLYDKFIEPPKCANPKCNNKVTWSCGKPGHWRKYCSYSCNATCTLRHDGRPMSLAAKQKLSEARKQYYATHPQTNMHKKWYAGWFQNAKFCLNATSVKYDSSYEFDFIDMVERLQIYYERSPIAFWYDGPDGTNHTYRPDFVVHWKNHKILIEIKAEGRVKDLWTQVKAKAAIAQLDKYDLHAYVIICRKEISWPTKHINDNKFIHILNKLIDKPDAITDLHLFDYDK